MNDNDKYANFLSDIKSEAKKLYACLEAYCADTECVNCKYTYKSHECIYFSNLVCFLHGYAMATPMQGERNAIINFLKTEFPNFKYPLR